MNNDLPPPERASFVSYSGRVGPDWIDVNRHMNTSWYDYVFDRAEKGLFDAFGLTEKRIRDTGLSAFRLEKLVEYNRETMLDDLFEVRSRLVWTDYRRLHHLHEMWNVTRGHRSAYADCISMHVDLSIRKGAEIADEAMRAVLARFLDANAALPLPVGVPQRVRGRRIGR
jgi:acyl-CoA thioester hydrolase